LEEMANFHILNTGNSHRIGKMTPSKGIFTTFGNVMKRRYPMMNLNKKVLTCALSISMLAAAAPAMPVFAATSTAATADATAEKPEKPEKKDFLSELVEAGSLTQTTYDNIQTYIKENAPERKEPTEGESAGNGKERPELPANEDGTRPEKPAQNDESRPADENGSRPEKPANEDGTMAEGKGREGFGMINTDLLAKMLEAEVITQSEYDIISASLPQMPDKN
jgi:hypothetical protein